MNIAAVQTVCYVLTSDGRDAFADMALVSMLSLRISNPGLRVVAVCDAASAEAIKATKHRILEVCDAVVSVPTPGGEPAFRNRWVKTQLCKYVEGEVLFLDADTLVRGSLEDLPALVLELGAVANHNGAALSDQIWSEDRQVLEGMDWPDNFDVYVNGGVFFFKPCPRVREFFARWHELWLAGVSANRRLRDQASLNSAILSSRVDMRILPPAYNAQLVNCLSHTSKGIVWHFYASARTDKTAFDLLVKTAKDMSLVRLQHSISRVLRGPAPWLNLDWFARHLAKRVELCGSARTEEWLWLSGRRMDAVRFTLGKARQALAKHFRRFDAGGR